MGMWFPLRLIRGLEKEDLLGEWAGAAAEEARGEREGEVEADNASHLEISDSISRMILVAS
jgi:hypothetical protein